MKATHIRLGDFNYGDNDDDEYAVEATISETIIHPNYTEGSFYHNIALIRLSQAVAFNSYVRPACLSESFQTEATVDTATWTGWPMKIFTYPRPLQDTPSMDLRKYVMKLISAEMCNEIYANQSRSVVMPMGVSAQQLCAELDYKARSTLELRPLEVSFDFYTKFLIEFREK